MKKAIIISGIFLFVFSGHVSAQMKYGHINSNEIVQAMPEFKQMSEAVEKRKKEAQLKVQQMYDTYQLKLKEVNQYGPSMMEAVKEEKMRDLDSMQRSIQVYEQTASSELQQFQDKLLKPLNDKYMKTVNAVAKENGYTYIFDLSSGILAYYSEGGDISEPVKKKLGIN